MLRLNFALYWGWHDDWESFPVPQDSIGLFNDSLHQIPCVCNRKVFIDFLQIPHVLSQRFLQQFTVVNKVNN